MSAVSVLIPVGVLLMCLKLLKSDGILRWLSVYVLISLLSECIGIAVNLTGEVINTLPLLHLYTIIEFSVLLYVFHRLPSGFPASVYAWIVSAFTLAAIASAVWLQSIYDYNTLMRATEAIVLLFFALRYFLRMWKNMDEEDLRGSFSLWFTAGVLLYFSGNLIVFVSSNLLLSSYREVNVVVWNFHAVLNILFNSLLAYSLWIRLRALN